MTDRETGEPIVICADCGKEEVGYVDNPDEEYYCDECREKW